MGISWECTGKTLEIPTLVMEPSRGSPGTKYRVPHCWQKNGFMTPIPSGKRLHNYGKSPFSMGNSTLNGHFQ